MDKRFLQKVVKIFSNIVNLIFIGVHCGMEKQCADRRHTAEGLPRGRGVMVLEIRTHHAARGSAPHRLRSLHARHQPAAHRPALDARGGVAQCLPRVFAARQPRLPRQPAGARRRRHDGLPRPHLRAPAREHGGDGIVTPRQHWPRDLRRAAARADHPELCLCRMSAPAQ